MEEIKELTIPDFTATEIWKIQSELSISRWEEAGKKISINKQWDILITKSERDWFRVDDMPLYNICTFLIQTWKVYMYWGFDDEHEWTGFQIIPKDNNTVNPYEILMSPLDDTIEKLQNYTSTKVKEIQESINNLEETKKSLELQKKRTQEAIWQIPQQIIDGLSPDEIQSILTEISWRYGQKQSWEEPTLKPLQGEFFSNIWWTCRSWEVFAFYYAMSDRDHLAEEHYWDWYSHHDWYTTSPQLQKLFHVIQKLSQDDLLQALRKDRAEAMKDGEEKTTAFQNNNDWNKVEIMMFSRLKNMGYTFLKKSQIQYKWESLCELSR